MEFRWDKAQIQVIEESEQNRILVSAGPGMGKTAVACARVASMIARGVPASGIWLISFTRTAVREIRDRIQLLANGNPEVGAVRISTLDSQAWHLRYGFGHHEDANLFRGFEVNIREAIEMLDDPQDQLREYIGTIRHLIVDEAQDLVGWRADLVLSLVRKLSPDAGVTVFYDPAQAIYGFALDDDSEPEPLPYRLMKEADSGFRELDLNTIHRTRSTSLLQIFRNTRQAVLGLTPDNIASFRGVVDSITHFSDAQIGDIKQEPIRGRNDILILYRTRADVLTLSSFLWEKDIPHRLRMSGLPALSEPWIGILLWDFTERYISESEFTQLWSARITGNYGQPMDKCWHRLMQIAGVRRRGVDVRALADILARSAPPAELACNEPGQDGPILSTIHASKGREADKVYFMLPQGIEADNYANGDLAEEGRVFFVAATRAKKELSVGTGYRLYGTNLNDERRTCRFPRDQKSPHVQFEVGRSGDVDNCAHVSRKLFNTPDEAQQAQEILRELTWKSMPVEVRSQREDDYMFHISARTGNSSQLVGALTRRVNHDLFHAADKIRPGRLKPPEDLKYIRIIGTGSAAVASGDSIRETMYEPFSTSGIFLVPVVSGFPTVYFRYRA